KATTRLTLTHVNWGAPAIARNPVKSIVSRAQTPVVELYEPDVVLIKTRWLYRNASPHSSCGRRSRPLSNRDRSPATRPESPSRAWAAPSAHSRRRPALRRSRCRLCDSVSWLSSLLLVFSWPFLAFIPLKREITGWSVMLLA